MGIEVIMMHNWKRTLKRNVYLGESTFFGPGTTNEKQSIHTYSLAKIVNYQHEGKFQNCSKVKVDYPQRNENNSG